MRTGFLGWIASIQTLSVPHRCGPPTGVVLPRGLEDDKKIGKRQKPENIVMKLRRVEVLHGQGMSVAEAVRQIGVTDFTYYRGRRQYGDLTAN